jgi:glutathione S-transferase
MGCCDSWLLWLGAPAILILYLGFKWFSEKRKAAVLERWNNTPKDTVILHGMYGGKHLPTASPFVLKLETYLRMANIPYEVDKVDFFGPKGKTPWISINKTHMGDSQLIVEFLKKKFEKDLSRHYTEEQRAIGTVVRVMLEEHVYWGGVLHRFVYGGRDTLAQVWRGEKTFGEWLLFTCIAPSLKSMAWSQGLGRHSEEEVKQLMLKDMRALSKILGEKRFLLGDEPCEEDCSVFAFVASVVFVPENPTRILYDGELKNLKAYCIRMKEKFWPDWDKRLAK